MLLIVRQYFLMTLSRKIIVFKPTLQTTNKFVFNVLCPCSVLRCLRRRQEYKNRFLGGVSVEMYEIVCHKRYIISSAGIIYSLKNNKEQFCILKFTGLSVSLDEVFIHSLHFNNKIYPIYTKTK